MALAVATPASAQSVAAVRLSGAPPRVDGRLTEQVWSAAPVVTGFLQREPHEGAPAPENTEVRFAYDDDALYVGARMFSDSPRDIRALVTRRDNEGISEVVFVSLDTYRDRRTAYTFGVTAAGVRIDQFHPSDDMDRTDSEFDPVWEASARIDSAGWVAEMRIPFTQLRFSPGETQLWGLNVARFVPARNEESFWILVRKQETGWSSRMGSLTGIRGIAPSRRIEAVPYVAANSRFARVEDPDDPFEHERQSYYRAGGDMKMGLGPNLTMDVTLNPDFGQVEADPAVVNLTAYETFFDERRPFFSEGSNLFDRRGFFYSRRIGASPPGNAETEFSEQPDNTTILGAAKLTGRLPSGLSVAGLAAVTDREIVRTSASGVPPFGRAEVAPLAGYAVASAQQEFGKDASTIGGMATLVQRDVQPGSPLASLLPRSAYSALLEGRLRWGGGEYDVNTVAGYTNVNGDSTAILRLQRSSRRYFQRPDADHVELDPSRRTLNGAILAIGHSKMAGEHWLWDVDYTQESPGLEPNDIGAFESVDNREFGFELRWRETQPSRLYRDYSIEVGGDYSWNYGWLRTRQGQSARFSITFPNYWEVFTNVSREGPSLSDRLTRGGPIMARAASRDVRIELQNGEGERTGWGMELGAERSDDGSWSSQVELGLDFRPGDRWHLSFDPEWSRGTDTRQYIDNFTNGRPETFGTRYVFAHVDVSEISAQLRLNYTFTPDLTLETYAEPFAASGRFHSFGELLAPRSGDLLVYGTGGTTISRNADGSHTVSADGQTFDIESEDFNERSFRSNAVLRWEWRPGSTLYFVWQMNLSADRPIAGVRPWDVWDSLRAAGDNFFAIKLSYWIPIS